MIELLCGCCAVACVARADFALRLINCRCFLICIF